MLRRGFSIDDDRPGADAVVVDVEILGTTGSLGASDARLIRARASRRRGSAGRVDSVASTFALQLTRTQRAIARLRLLSV